jgi:hypothetical protein
MPKYNGYLDCSHGSRAGLSPALLGSAKSPCHLFSSVALADGRARLSHAQHTR